MPLPTPFLHMGAVEPGTCRQMLGMVAVARSKKVKMAARSIRSKPSLLFNAPCTDLPSPKVCLTSLWHRGAWGRGGALGVFFLIHPMAFVLGWDWQPVISGHRFKIAKYHHHPMKVIKMTTRMIMWSPQFETQQWDASSWGHFQQHRVGRIQLLFAHRWYSCVRLDQTLTCAGWRLCPLASLQPQAAWKNGHGRPCSVPEGRQHGVSRCWVDLALDSTFNNLTEKAC